jgi:hypothetical protein
MVSWTGRSEKRAAEAIEEQVASAEQVGVGGWIAGEEGADLDLEFLGDLFVGIEGEDPVRGALIDGGVFLGGESLPWLAEDFGVGEGGCDLDGAVGGAGVDDDELVSPADAGEGAAEVGLLVAGDDGYGECHLHAWHSLPRWGLEEREYVVRGESPLDYGKKRKFERISAEFCQMGGWGRFHSGQEWRLGEGDGGVVELLLEEPLDERLEGFSGFGEGEGLRRFGPVELVTGGLGGDPDLADGGIGGDDELAGPIFEEDVHDAVVVFELEGAQVVAGGDEGLFEGFEGEVGHAAEGSFVDHGTSLAGLGGSYLKVRRWARECV